MADRPAWMTKMDERILDLMEKTKRVKVDGMWVSAKSIALALDASADYVSSRINELHDRGYLDNDGRFYRINSTGSNHIQSDSP